MQPQLSDEGLVTLSAVAAVAPAVQAGVVTGFMLGDELVSTLLFAEADASAARFRLGIFVAFWSFVLMRSTLPLPFPPLPPTHAGVEQHLLGTGARPPPPPSPPRNLTLPYLPPPPFFSFS